MFETQEDIIKYQADLVKYYENLHGELNTKENVYNGVMTFKVPDGFDKHVPPTAFNRLEQGVNHLSALKLKIEVPERKSTKQATEQSGELTQFCSKVRDQIGLSDFMDPIRQLEKDLFIFGVGYLKGPIWDYDVWDDEPEPEKGKTADEYREALAAWKAHREAAFPVKVAHVDPRLVFPDPSFPPKFFYETVTRKAIMINNNWPDWNFGNGRFEPFENIEWNEYWDEKRRFFWVSKGKDFRMPITEISDGKEVSGVRPNIYGYVPYSGGYSGLGRKGKNCLPEDMACGMLDRVIDSLKAEARLKTACDAATQLAAWNNLVADEEGGKIDLDFSPAALNRVPREANLRPMNIPTLSADAYRYLDIVSREIDESLGSPSVMGMKIAGIDTGIQQSTLLHQDKLKYLAVAQPVTRIVSDVFSKILRMLDTLDEELYGIGKKQIKKYFIVNVSFDTMTPEEKDRRYLLGKNLAGELSWHKRAKEFYGVEDLSEEQMWQLVEMGLKSPRIAEVLVNGALQDAGASEYQEQAQEQAAQQTKSGFVGPMEEGGIRKIRRETPLLSELGTRLEQEGER